MKLADPIADQMVMIEPFAAQDLTVLVRFGQWPDDSRGEAAGRRRACCRPRSITSRTAPRSPRPARPADAEADLAALKAAAAKLPEGRDARPVEFGGRCRRGRDRRSHRAHRRREGRHGRRDQGLHGGGRRGGQARLQRAARLVDSRARASRRGAAQGRTLRRRREGVPRRSGEEHRQSAVALRPVSRARGPEESTPPPRRRPRSTRPGPAPT